MVLRFGATKAEDVAGLIAKKNYSRAIEVIREQLKSGRPDARLRMQLGDVLIMAGRGREAVQVLLPVADEYASEGFAAKAVAVLKKIQKLEPGRRDIEQRLAEVIEEKQRYATSSLPLTPAPSGGTGGFEIGIEEIGFQTPSGGAISVPAPPTPVPAPPVLEAPPALDLPPLETGPELSLGLPPLQPRPAARVPPPAPPPAPAPPAPPPVVARPPAPPPRPASPQREVPPPPPPPPVEVLQLPDLDLAPEGPLFDLGTAAPAGGPAPAATPPAPATARPAELLDQDLFTDDPDLFGGDGDETPTLEILPDPETQGSDTMTDGLFAQELLSLVDDAFANLPTTPDGELAPPTGDLGPPAGQQIVISPLFKDFAVDEMVAVIQGLSLLTFEPRQIILREGAAGSSMYMLTAGTAKAYVRDPQGKQRLVGELSEGAFFGEISLLTGKPRTATVVAATRCEVLELGQATLGDIESRHPHVREVLEQFARERLARRG